MFLFYISNCIFMLILNLLDLNLMILKYYLVWIFNHFESPFENLQNRLKHFILNIQHLHVLLKFNFFLILLTLNLIVINIFNYLFIHFIHLLRLLLKLIVLRIFFDHLSVCFLSFSFKFQNFLYDTLPKTLDFIFID
jgi:hypothetical protein